MLNLHFAGMELSQDTRNILGLQLPTDPRWVNLAGFPSGDPHRSCFVNRRPPLPVSPSYNATAIKQNWSKPSPIVTEEWGHFRLVLAELHKRGLSLGRQRKDEYVNALLGFQQKGGHWEGRMLDQLLTMALIEARAAKGSKD